MRKQNFTIESKDFYNLASNLFGVQNPDQTKLKNYVASSTAVEQLKPATEKANDKRLFAVYPAIIEEAFAQTMDNFRKYVALKNFQFKEENFKINTYNNNVIAFKKLNNALCFEMFNNVEAFIKNRKSFSPVDYNEAVEQFNNLYGMLIRKKKLITIKPTAELVFQNMLCIYNQQLMIKNKRYIGCGITEATPLQAFKVNAWRVTQLKRNGVQSLPLCKKTILNHRKRLEEFGVFVDYHFINSSHGVEVHINPEILVIKDIFDAKVRIAENQVVTSESVKIVPNDNDIFTGTYINEMQNERKVKNFPIVKEFPLVTPFIFSFTGTPTRTEAIKLGAGENVPSQVNTANMPAQNKQNIFEKVLDTIVDDSQLAKQLENCEFNNYIPIDLRLLHTIAYSSFINRDQFFDIVMIDFFKSLQKNIYKKGNVFFGSWYNAIKLFRLQRWNNINGGKHKPTNLVDYITKYRWRIQWARNWYRNNPNVTPLFPNQYLDVTRKTSKEVGFEYTKSKWINQQNELKKYDDLVLKQTREAKKRGEIINYNKKLELHLNRFSKNKITLTQLYDYVQKNLPPAFLQKLPDLVESKMLKCNKKTILLQSQDVIRYSPIEF
ncbi:hypothetical protein [Flavobacterium sp.]|uniref:hypothetical protein n=1 Tax=Flavobacterium sp. TaxID=239 RepID=UPI00375172CB